MTTARVPFRRTGVVTSEIQVGASVRAPTWRSVAELAHWARGRGMALVPGTFCGRQISSGSETFHYYMRPSPFAIGRIWAIQAHGIAAPAEITVAIGSAGPFTYVLDSSTWLGSAPILIGEDLAAKVTAITDTTVTITRVSGTVQIDTVCAFELPRFGLDLDSTEYGVSLESLFAQDVIYDAGNVSAHAIAELVDDLNPRRIYFQHYGEVWSTSSASYQPMFTLPLPVLGQKLTSATTETITWSAYARITAAGDGDVQIATNSGNTDSINITNTSLALVGTSTVSINAEDPTKEDGLPGGTRETVQINGRVNSGGGNIEIVGAYAWRDS